MFDKTNKLIIIGNGFDLAHGLNTSYKNFLDWYMCKMYNEFCKNNYYGDPLIEVTNAHNTNPYNLGKYPETSLEVLDFLKSNANYSVKYKSNFFNRIIGLFHENNWVDVERFYFRLLKGFFSNSDENFRVKAVLSLNKDFDFLIKQLGEYIKKINMEILEVVKLKADNTSSSFNKIFYNTSDKIKVLNFNYTETVQLQKYANDDDIIYIHGRVADEEVNPIIFGYGDESDPVYQNIEDSGENLYLEHIKSFGYFKTGNYNKLLSYIDSAPYIVYIVGHSCGLSDRVLLNEIFEHSNCQKIDIFYHIKKDGSDNFKEITQEISRHFKPHNKNIMRRKILDKNYKNIIPQNISKM